MISGPAARVMLGALVSTLLLIVAPTTVAADPAADPAAGPASRAAVAAGAAPLRVLIIGDSVTHGSAGDWTWRYRLWQHLTADGTAVDFVGPRDDLWDNIAGGGGLQDYVHPDFDRDHAARWGATQAFYPDTDYRFEELVATYEPDVVIEMLGVNDLNFLGHTPDQVAARLRTFVSTIRAEDPEIDVVLGRLSQTWFAQVDELNVLIDQLANDLDDPESRVVAAAVDEGFTLREDTWDAAHPNAQGEVRIAAAMADALAVLGLAAPYPRPLPSVPLGPRLPAVLAAEPGDGVAFLSWTGAPGADHEVVWVRDETRGGDWSPLPAPVEGTSFVLEGLTNAHTYSVSLQPVKGYWAAQTAIRSNVVRVRPLPPLPGQVRLTGATSPRRDKLRVTGTPAAGATSYRLDLALSRSCSTGPVRFRRHVSLDRPRTVVTTAARFARVRLVALNVAGAGSPSATSGCLRVR